MIVNVVHFTFIKDSPVILGDAVKDGNHVAIDIVSVRTSHPLIQTNL